MIEVAITDVCDFQGGTQPPKSEWSPVELPGYVRMLQIRDFTQAQERHIEYVKNKSTLKLCNTEDILIGRYGASIGKILTGLSGAYNVAIVKTIPKESKLNRNFLLHLLRGQSFQSFIQNIGSRAAQAGFNKEDLKKFKFILPTLIEQQKIAAILDAADSLRQKDQQLIERYTALSQSLFLEMFGDPVTNSMGWEKVQLNKLCSFKKVTIAPENIKTGTKYLALEGIEKESGEIVEYKVVENGELKSNKFYFDEDTILYGKLRPYLNKVALPNFNGICSTEIIPIKPIGNETNKYFIVQIIRSAGFVKFADENSSGANLPRINPNEVERYKTIQPPIELQNRFAKRIQLIEAQKQQAQLSLEKSEALFNSLLQRAFTGELTAKMAA